MTSLGFSWALLLSRLPCPTLDAYKARTTLVAYSAEEAPLLASSTLRHFCDEILFVNSTEALRETRVKVRGWSPDELQRREANQAPESDKKILANSVINNSGSLDETRQQVEDLYESLLAIDFTERE